MNRYGSRTVLQCVLAGVIAFSTALPATADVLIFGGTRGVGLETARLLAAAGEPVTVLVRETSDVTALSDIDGVTRVIGDALVPGSVAAAFASGEFDAAVSTLSGNPEAGFAVDSVGSINAIDAAKAAGAQRFILVSSIGVGDSAKALPQAALDALAHVLVEKTKAENHLIDSGLDYTIIRPGGLLDKPANGLGVLTEDVMATGIVGRAEVARLIVDALGDEGAINKVYTAIEVK